MEASIRAADLLPHRLSHACVHAHAHMHTHTLTLLPAITELQRVHTGMPSHRSWRPQKQRLAGGLFGVGSGSSASFVMGTGYAFCDVRVQPS